MAFDWTDFLEVAALLAKEAANAVNAEAFHRSAVDRAYFAAFRHALDFAVKGGFRAKYNEEDHGGVREFLKKRRFTASKHLGELRVWRNAATYDSALDWPDSALTVASAIEAAKEVIRHLAPSKQS
jgi:hypothetical protein